MPAEPSRGSIRVLVELVRSAAGAVSLHPLRSAVTVACVVTIVLPYLVGTAVSNGLRDEIDLSVQEGPDLFVTATRFGRTVPLPGSAAEVVGGVPGVTAVIPRIVGEARLGVKKESAVVVGLPAHAVPETLECVEGRLFAPGSRNELVIGSELARRLGLRVGDAVPPFYRSRAGERVSRVVGVFTSDAPLWQAHVVLTSLDSAQNVFDEGDTVTSLLVTCPPRMRDAIAGRIRTLDTLGAAASPVALRARVSTRDDVQAALLRRSLDRETLFQLPFILAFAVGIPLILVTSGAGLVGRRREAGLLRAIGWSADALLFRAFVESVLLAVAGASIAVLAAYVWLDLFSGAGIAPVLLPGADRIPGFRVPWRLTPEPVLLGCILSAVLVGVGTLHSTWRAASAPAARAMR